MKKNIVLFIVGLSLIFTTASFCQNEVVAPIQCVLKGEVINRPQSTRLMLLKPDDDPRTTDVIYILVQDGKFEYVLNADTEEAYQLIFEDEDMNGSMMPIDFIAEQGTINFVLYPMDEWEKNVIEGGNYTNEYLTIEKNIQYVTEHPNIVGYTFLVKNIRFAIEQSKEDVSSLLKIYREIYLPKYAYHPYTALIESYTHAASVKVGNRYVDVTAVDKDDKEVKLSELIQGKVALIHLWGSWCGPCRKHGKEMIPVYEQYKDKGFTVVGIARERSKNAMVTAIEKDKCPWINLLELNDQHEIWRKFGVGNAGGGDFLVDENGVFLAIGASAEEIRKILENIYDKK
jgi:thiol-disulfide isomerase/thioredoxin/uncharacterized protein YuzE